MRPTVSVVIPTYGRPQFLERCLDSLVAQTWRPLELVIVDDNGRGTAQQIETQRVVAKVLSGVDLSHRYFPLRRNSGGSYARNLGVRLSSGELVTFLDDDDAYLPGKVAAQAETLLAHPHLSFVWCGMAIRDGNGRLVRTKELYPEGSSRSLLSVHLNHFLTGTPALMLRRDWFRRVGGFSPVPALQDADLLLKLLAAGAEARPVRSALVTVYEHDQGRVTLGARKLGAIATFGRKIADLKVPALRRARGTALARLDILSLRDGWRRAPWTSLARIALRRALQASWTTVVVWEAVWGRR